MLQLMMEETRTIGQLRVLHPTGTTTARGLAAGVQPAVVQISLMPLAYELRRQPKVVEGQELDPMNLST